jgi:hypothetical protein
VPVHVRHDENFGDGFPSAPQALVSQNRWEGVCGMKLYRVDKLAKPGGMVVKKKHILAESDPEAVRHAEDSDDCPVCEVRRDGETVGRIL